MNQLGLILKEAGQDLVEASNGDWMGTIREVARVFSRGFGEVTSDDLRLWCDKNDCQPKHPNAWGSVFRGKHWVAIGLRRSTYPSNHGRRIVVWRSVA
jgi:hypothetical protein